MAFDTEIQALAGTATTSEMSQWMTDGVKEIVNILPLELKVKCTSRTSITDLNGTDLDSKGEILYITRLSADSGGFEKACREILPMYGDLTNDSSDMMYYAVVTDPVYFKTNNASGNPTLFVRPNPTAAQPAYVHHISYPSITSNSDTTIANFPDEAEYLVVLYASIKVLQNKMNEKSGNLPSDISEVVLAIISTSLPTYTSPSSFVLPVLPAGADVSYTEVGSIETFISPIFTIPALASISSMSLPSIPVAPAMSEKSVTITGTAPTYTPPVVGLSSLSTISDLSITSVAPVPPTLSDNSVTFSATVPTFIAPVMNAPDWNDTNTWISTEEDSEMLGARVAEIQGKVGEYSARIQEAQAKFQEELNEYQTEFQKSVKNADLDSQDDNQKIQQFQSDIQLYQANANNEIQTFQQNMQKNLQVFTSKTQVELTKYQADIQNQLNVFNKESAEYQAKLQKDVQDAQLKESKEGRDLQKYTQELASYQAEVNKEVQRWTGEEFNKKFNEWAQKYQGQLAAYGSDIQNQTARVTSSLNDYQAKVQKALGTYQAETGYDVTKYSAEIQANTQKFNSDLQDNSTDYMNNLQKYQAEIGKLTEENQSKIGKYSQDIANYGAKIQKHSADYQWLYGQWQALKQDYNQGIQMLVGGGTPQPQQQQGER